MSAGTLPQSVRNLRTFTRSILCLYDNVCTAMHYCKNPQQHMIDADVMTTHYVASNIVLFILVFNFRGLFRARTAIWVT